MGTYGVHSGVYDAKNVKVGGKYVANSRVVYARDFQLLQSGGVVSTTTPAKEDAIGSVGSVSSLAFDSGADNGAKLIEIVPGTLGSNVGMDVTVYWTSSGVGHGRGEGVVWDIDYRTFTKFSSGVDIYGYTYTISGTTSNATTTGYFYPWDDVLSGALCSTTIRIPKSGVKANSVVEMLLYRDVGEAADNFLYPAHLIGATIEYVEA